MTIAGRDPRLLRGFTPGIYNRKTLLCTPRRYRGILIFAMLGDFKFCPRCTAPLGAQDIEGTDRPVCTACGRVVYHDPKVTAATVVERGGEVLMVRRGTEPGMGLWCLPGGCVDRGEVVERAAEREVMEETGLQVNVTGLVGVFSETGHPVILITYDSHIVGGSLKPGPEVLELGFFSLDGLPSLAFHRDRQLLVAWKLFRDGNC